MGHQKGVAGKSQRIKKGAKVKRTSHNPCSGPAIFLRFLWPKIFQGLTKVQNGRAITLVLVLRFSCDFCGQKY